MTKIPVKQIDLNPINGYIVNSEATEATITVKEGENYIFETPLTKLTIANTASDNIKIEDFIYTTTIRFKCGDTPTDFKHNADVIKWAQSSLPALEPNCEYIIALWKGIGVMKEIKIIDDYTVPTF